MSTETSNPVINVAIAGCGTIGRTHAASVAEIADLQVTALVDEIAEAADALAQHIEDQGAARPATFRSLDEAFEGADVDLVIIATPSGLHIEQALEVLNAGKHVVIEKPLDVNLNRTDEILAAAKAAEEKGLVASVISQHRFDPASIVVDEARRAGRFGRRNSAKACRCWSRSQGD